MSASCLGVMAPVFTTKRTLRIAAPVYPIPAPTAAPTVSKKNAPTATPTRNRIVSTTFANEVNAKVPGADQIRQDKARHRLPKDGERDDLGEQDRAFPLAAVDGQHERVRKRDDPDSDRDQKRKLEAENEMKCRSEAFRVLV